MLLSPIRPSSVFKPNHAHRQHSIFATDQLLPAKYQQRLRTSWSHTFRRDVFTRIDESAFAVLYSEEASRPNAPINVLVGAEILKAGFGWSDRELADEMAYNLQVRYALGLEDLAMEVPELRTLYNLRRRIRDHAEETGTNLLQGVFQQVTDEQLEALKIETRWQRVDSTQILSNLARMSRLEFVLSVVQKLARSLGESALECFADRLEPYLGCSPRAICGEVKPFEVNGHLWKLGMILVAWAQEEGLFDERHRALLERVLHEQFEVVDRAQGNDDLPEKYVRVREEKNVSAGSLQSVHDWEATYRVKNGETYRGGFVVNVSETCDPKNQMQLITDVQVAPNATDDGELLERSLDAQAERGVEVAAVTVDGGYTGERAEDACELHEVELRATNMRGGTSSSGKFGWETYEWIFDEQGRPVAVRCPKGETARLEKGRSKERLIARFTADRCESCPFFGGGCRVESRRPGPTLNVSRRIIRTALQRQRLRPEDKPVRAVVEATIRSVKHPFRRGKLPVRGLVRATMMICAAALMVNLRRIHEHRRNDAGEPLFGWFDWLPRRLCAAIRQVWHWIRSESIGADRRVAMT